MTDDGEALDAPTIDDARSDEERHAETAHDVSDWNEALSAELHKRALAPMSLDSIMRDLGYQRGPG